MLHAAVVIAVAWDVAQATMRPRAVGERNHLADTCYLRYLAIVLLALQLHRSCRRSLCSLPADMAFSRISTRTSHTGYEHSLLI